MKKIGFKQKIFIMGIICLMFSFFVWDWTEKQINLYLGQINSGLERVAQVQTKSNHVIRNHNGQLLWQNIDAGEVIYLGNSIQTEKDSSTEIIFDDGEKILVGPESLVRFNRADDKISLQLVEGKIEVHSPDEKLQEDMRLEGKPKRLFIKTPRGRLNLKNATLKLKADKNDENNFKVEVVKGEPELVTANEKEILPVSTVTETEKIEVVKIDETKTELLKPEDTKTEDVIAAETTPTETVTEELSSDLVELTPNSTQTIIAADESPRQPAMAPLTAPKVKSIKVKEVE